LLKQVIETQVKNLAGQVGFSFPGGFFTSLVRFVRLLINQAEVFPDSGMEPKLRPVNAGSLLAKAVLSTVRRPSAHLNVLGLNSCLWGHLVECSASSILAELLMMTGGWLAALTTKMPSTHSRGRKC
jgi:hypothetical protein